MAREFQRKDNKGHWPLTSVWHGTTQDLSRTFVLIPRSKIHLQKPTVAQLVKKFTFLLPKKLHRCLQEPTTGLYPGPDEYTPHIRLTFIFKSEHSFQSPSPPNTQKTAFLSSPLCATSHTHFFLGDIIALIFDDAYKSSSSLLWILQPSQHKALSSSLHCAS